MRQCQKEVRYLADRLAREERARGEAKTSDNETRFEQLSNNSTLIKVAAPSHRLCAHGDTRRVRGRIGGRRPSPCADAGNLMCAVGDGGAYSRRHCRRHGRQTARRAQVRPSDELHTCSTPFASDWEARSHLRWSLVALCRQQYEIDLKAVAEQAEMDDDDDSLVPQDAAAGAGAPEEEEEEWEMLDRLREEETRLKQAPVMKQRETFVTRPAPAPVAKAPRAPAPPANSKQAKVSQIMADTSLSPAERQRQVYVSALWRDCTSFACCDKMVRG